MTCLRKYEPGECHVMVSLQLLQRRRVGRLTQSTEGGCRDDMTALRAAVEEG